MDIVKLAVLSIVAVSLAITCSRVHKEIATYITIGICIMILYVVVGKLKVVVQLIQTISSYVAIDSLYMGVLLKLIGIAYVCEFAAGISKDAGYSVVASQIELAGKLSMLGCSMPIVMAILETINQFFI